MRAQFSHNYLISSSNIRTKDSHNKIQGSLQHILYRMLNADAPEQY